VPGLQDLCVPSIASNFTTSFAGNQNRPIRALAMLQSFSYIMLLSMLLSSTTLIVLCSASRQPTTGTARTTARFLRRRELQPNKGFNINFDFPTSAPTAATRSVSISAICPYFYDNKNGNLYSLYHCEDPQNSANFVIGCNKNTCQWDLSQLNPTAPPGFCESVTVLNAHPEDLIKPCLIWEIMYGGRGSKTASPSSVNNGA
jgi:hypothetical protein